MRSAQLLLAGAATAAATTLADVCTKEYAVANLPDGVLEAITIHKDSVSAHAFYNESFTDEDFYPNTVIDYCNVTFAYTHHGVGDKTHVSYWLPAPDNFENRFLTTGGGGLAINSGNDSTPGGVSYGAVAGITDGGFGNFDNQFDSVFPLANGTANWQAVYMFGYQAIFEMTVLGKAFTTNFYNMNSTTKLYAYYQACSEGGREGWSQVQRYDTFDGAIIGAPAMRYSFQQVQHLFSNIVELTQDYYPSNCELLKITTETIKHCDPLDGKTDGVIARSDLCKLDFNYTTLIGTEYHCAAVAESENGPASPESKGKITAEAVKLVQTINDGLYDSDGNFVYFSYQPGANFTDAETQYNTATDSYELDQSGLGGEWVFRYLMLQDGDLLPSLENVTYDTLRDWMIQGLHMYSDSLQTDWPDLTPYYTSGGKVLHFHGESDYSIPTASSVRYHEAVREIMYPNMSFNDSQAALNEWYKLYLVPGGSHCEPDYLQPNGPWPQTNLQVMIDWVEKGIEPTTLNATVLQGDEIGENRQICQWPLRPYWPSQDGDMECVYDQRSLDTWFYNITAIPIPIY